MIQTADRLLKRFTNDINIRLYCFSYILEAGVKHVWGEDESSVQTRQEMKWRNPCQENYLPSLKMS
jgi:hypothetical protein